MHCQNAVWRLHLCQPRAVDPQDRLVYLCFPARTSSYLTPRTLARNKAALLQVIAAGAGVHIYVNTTDNAVDGVGNSLMVHAGHTPGARRVQLPVAAAVTEDTGTVVCPAAAPCRSFHAEAMRAGETRLYFLA